MASGADSISQQARKFNDDDFRCAVRLLDAAGNNLDVALNAAVGLTLWTAAEVLQQRMEDDREAVKQLLIVTDSFRDVLGLKKPVEEMHGERVKAS